MGLSTRKKVELDLAQLEILANSRSRRMVDKLIEYVDNWNVIFEDSTRLSVYRQALKQGLSKDRAAALAKEATINFNRMGKGGPLINALWMFSNASIQGTTKTLRSLKDPKVLGATVLVVGGAVAATSEWNDSVDPDWRTKVAKWDRLNSLPVAIPTTDGGVRYISIPVSWGVKPIKVMADYAYDAFSGIELNPEDIVKNTLTAILEAYNPVGGTDITSAITPTILDVPVELARNKKWSGSQIKPTKYDPNTPEDIRYYSSLKETKLGQAAISLTEMLQGKLGVSISPADIKYAFEQYTGGAGRTISKTVNTITGIGKGKELPLDEYPFLSRFYRQSSKEEVERFSGEINPELQKLNEQELRDSFYLKQQAESLYETLLGLPKEEANRQAKDVEKNNPRLYEKLKNIVEDKKFNYSTQEKQIKDLGVENGSRARYIWEQINKYQTLEEKKAYIKDLQGKKIITDSVTKQLKELEAEAKKSQATSGISPEEISKVSKTLGNYSSKPVAVS
ncbi:MAG TPA: LPD38 domain-containing protein, partial [Flavobacterium sp.]|nr:LPD38 domain-containing protein [Flavobacterium sp.]